MRSLLVYAPRVLPASQTFVAEQSRAMQCWRPQLVGRDRVHDGLDVDDLVPQVDWSTSSLRRARQRATRRVPTLAEAVRARPPDLIHAHFLTGGLDVVSTLRPPPCPVVVTAHGFDATWYGLRASPRRPQQWAYGWGRRRLLARDLRFIAVSRFIKDELVRLGAPSERVVVHYTGVDTDLFSPPSEAPRSGVLFVGRLVPKKGLDHLLDALARLAHQGRPVPLRVVGEGPERARLEARATRDRVAVRFLGSQPPAVVRDEMRRAAVLCVPSCTDRSTGDREGLGMVFAEAQATGLPVVSTRSGGIPEVVEDGRTGLLVPEADPLALAAAIDAILADPGLWARLSAAARPWVLQRFDLRKQTAVLEGLYDRWAAEPSPGKE